MALVVSGVAAGIMFGEASFSNFLSLAGFGSRAVRTL